MTVLLDIRGLDAAYDGAPVLHDVNLQVDEGGFVVVIGANTAGKSTLLRAISGLVPKVQGQVMFRGRNLLTLASHRIPELGSARQLLLLNEPSHGPASKVVQELHLALECIAASGVTVLLVEQNTQLALSVATHAFVLQSGRVVLHGASKDLLGDARIREAYLGI